MLAHHGCHVAEYLFADLVAEGPDLHFEDHAVGHACIHGDGCRGTRCGGGFQHEDVPVQLHGDGGHDGHFHDGSWACRNGCGIVRAERYGDVAGGRRRGGVTIGAAGVTGRGARVACGHFAGGCWHLCWRIAGSRDGAGCVVVRRRVGSGLGRYGYRSARRGRFTRVGEQRFGAAGAHLQRHPFGGAVGGLALQHDGCLALVDGGRTTQARGDVAERIGACGEQLGAGVEHFALRGGLFVGDPSGLHVGLGGIGFFAQHFAQLAVDACR